MSLAFLLKWHREPMDYLWNISWSVWHYTGRYLQDKYIILRETSRVPERGMGEVGLSATWKWKEFWKVANGDRTVLFVQYYSREALNLQCFIYFSLQSNGFNTVMYSQFTNETETPWEWVMFLKHTANNLTQRRNCKATSRSWPLNHLSAIASHVVIKTWE